MDPLKNNMVTRKLDKKSDDRGSLTEMMRSDWGHTIKQVNISTTNAGVIRAWHRHERGQYDYIIILSGRLKICTYDPKTKALHQCNLDSTDMRLVRIPGHLWHGYKVLGLKPATIIYMVSNLYNYKNPDELRADPASFKPKTVNGIEVKKWEW